MNDYKILSLDGGGAWALIQAIALGKLFNPDTPGRDILRRFDLVAATSGGSLVAGLLAVGMSPNAIRDIFLEEPDRRKIFVEKFFAFATRFIGIGPRYKTVEKLVGIRDIIAHGSKCGLNGYTTLDKLANGESKFPHFLITSFDYDRQRAVFFRSNRCSLASSSDSSKYKPVSLAEALHASSNAPVNYFDEPARFDDFVISGQRFWDGGTAGLNNPILVGVIEAITNNIDPKDIKILSIGTGSVMLPVEDDSVHPPLAISRDSTGIFSAIKKLAKTIVDDPPDTATFDAYRVLHGSQTDNPPCIRVVRFNPLIQPVKNCTDAWSLPDSLSEDEFSLLVKLDMDAVEQDEVELIKRFCDLWIENLVPNQPIQNDKDLKCKIGDSWFSDAKSAAVRIGLI